MKKIICVKCGKPNVHFLAHALGRCSCGAGIKFCSYCGVAIRPGGDSFRDSYHRGIKVMGGEKYTDTINTLRYRLERMKAKLKRKNKAAG